MRGDPLPKSAVTPVTPVTGPSRYRSKPLELQALQPLQVENSKLENDAFPPETQPETDLAESIRDAIEERTALCAGAIPPIYLDARARLNRAGPGCLNSFPRKISGVLPVLVCIWLPGVCRDAGRA
jgi:hypothetical protein